MKYPSLSLSFQGLCIGAVMSTGMISQPIMVQPAIGAPDWQSRTFADLDGFKWPGNVSVPGYVAALLGYDPSRQWTGQESLGDVLWLGDLQGSYAPSHLSLEDIQALTGQDLTAAALDQLLLLSWQSLGDVVTAVPALANLSPASVPVLQEVLAAAAMPVDIQTPLEELIKTPSTAALPLDQANLGAYRVADIPGLMETPLQNFRDFERTPLAGVPGLTSIPLARFPGVANHGLPTPVLADIVFGEAEGQVNRTVSGSYQEGFAVPCVQNCAHVELGWPFEGMQWVSGLSQQVQGGYGVLGQVNNGLEPTGRHPFGDSFKVAVLETDEVLGIAETGLFFRFCIKRRFLDLGCTPYFIGPVPWFPIHETEMTVL
ncbi:hypothetical protein PN498_13220 [Oscillatoria sp. CS-180]|uniref:hypothetical protein n=1 Tax=Oscillatoria sp. CS-180 TaxID=3021720 RepID=UPI00232DB520|nr:hypothetical protein [Oscillatoria sp. CS-180]MDB9526954.1 hypothetical protein [Oscillatoria sp. CS-180]